MARFLISTMPGHGHINPAQPIARKLIERGHEVWWHTGARFRDKVEATGARFTPASPAAVPRFFDQDASDSGQPRGLAKLRADLQHLFVETIPAQLRDLTEIRATFPADVVLADNTSLGPMLLYEQYDVPWAALSITALSLPSPDTGPFTLGMPPATSAIKRLQYGLMHWMFGHILMRPIISYANRQRAELGLARLPRDKTILNLPLSPFLYLQGTVPSFEYPRRRLPPQIHFVGPLLPPKPAVFAPPAWWSDLDRDRPVVLVTQGTIATKADELVIPTLRGLASEDMLVVAVTGTANAVPIPSDALPANAWVESFIPFHYLLPHVDVMVTNGGYGGVQMALAHGVPLVGAGQSEEKPEVCARLAWAGVGIDLKTQTPTPEQIRHAVRRVLGDPTYRHNAKRIQADMASYDAPTQTAALLEQLAATKRPVYRSG